MLRLLYDDSGRVSDADAATGKGNDPIVETDNTIYADDTAASYEGANYTDDSDNASKPTEPNSPERADRMDKAKQGIQSKDKAKDKSSDKNSKQDTPRRSFFSRNKKPGKKNDFLPPGSDKAKSDKDKKKDSSKGGAGDGNDSGAQTGLSKLKSFFGKGGDNAHDAGGLKGAMAKDPRKIAVQALDHVGLGRRVGDVMFMVWVIVTVILSIFFVFPGIIGLLMLNLLLVWPKAVYKITVWILIFIPVVGEVAKAVDTAGLGKVDIKLNAVEIYFIVIADLIWFIGMLALFGFLMTIICFPINNTGVVVTGAADIWYGTSLFSELQAICKGI